MELFKIGFLSFGFLDILDIFLVTVLFYQVYRLMRGTRATQMFAGLLVILVAGSLAQLVGMSGLSWLIQSIGAVWVVAFVILFQPELRRALIRVGELGWMQTFFKVGSEKVVSEVSKAAMKLSRRRFGGLIVFQRSTGIRGVIETGVTIQAEVSWDLLVSIFFPRTPLHDGAVIISEGTIVAARCILPLSISAYIEPTLGTRHRAAIGITEELDALAIVISEETGNVSLVEDGKFIGIELDEEKLKSELTRLLYPRSRSTSKNALTKSTQDIASQAATGGGEIA
ncbi:MAG: diadenylate cyclase CdaA [Candidatus Hatepunaea meridiana]|nr:diadenylate cyclase CdaA [Candidatus Hatepunaea meridiana]